MLRSTRRATPAASLAALLFSLAACGGGADAEQVAVTGETPAAEGVEAAPADAPAQPQQPVGPATDLPPNELGRIMVLEYHRLGSPEGEWYRTAENFRKDLRTLYERGYRPVTMKQVMDGDIDLPAGTTPVVFTVDDASRGQFYLRPDGSIDPNTMVGMWKAFQEENPGWRNGAVWCILPAAEHPSNFFGETPDRETPRAQREETIRKKMEYLVQNGHEVCNHTLYHARLDRGTDAQVQEWIGRGEDSLQVYLPEGYDVRTHALPLGMWPKNRSLAWRGTWNGKPYEYDVVLEVSGGPNVSPFHKQWDPHSVDRFIVMPGALERQLDAWDRDPAQRYVSDGDPDVVSYPRAREADLARERLGSRTARPVDAAPAPAAPAAAPPST